MITTIYYCSFCPCQVIEPMYWYFTQRFDCMPWKTRVRTCKYLLMINSTKEVTDVPQSECKKQIITSFAFDICGYQAFPSFSLV